MATWPTSLPQTPLLEGFSDAPQSSVIRTSMTGLTKQRNRYTAVVSDVKEVYLLTPAQFTTLLAFYTDTLKNGSLSFIKYDVITATNKSYRFTKPYEDTFNGVQHKVKLTLEKMP